MSDSGNLKEYINKLVELESEEEKYKNILLELKKKKENVNNLIINFMEHNNITDKDIIFGDKKIKYSKMKVQECITKKLIEERLKVFLKNDLIANDATKFIYSDRNSNQKVFLKITNIKN
jgi:hypothetical protein